MAIATVPVTFTAVVAEVAFPLRAAVTVPAEKLPLPSLLTRVDGVLELVAFWTVTAAEETAEAVWPPTNETTVAPWVPVTSPTNGPVKEAADPEALPVRFAVIVPAEKLAEASRLTMVAATAPAVAALASKEPDATLAADCPPTRATAVDP